MDTSSLAQALLGQLVSGALLATPLLVGAWLADALLVRWVWPQLLALAWWCALLRFGLPVELHSPWSLSAPLAAPAIAWTDPVALAAADSKWCVLAYGGCASLLLVRCAARRRLAHSLRPVALTQAWSAALARATRRAALERAPRVLCSDSLASPAVTGLWRPMLLLPSAWLAREPATLEEHALLHECVHLARRDPWREEGRALLRALLWWHPLVWIASARLHRLSELACDQRVASLLGAEAGEYRNTLLRVAREQGLGRSREGLHAFFGARHPLVLRIACLERVHGVSRLKLRGCAAVLALALALCIVPMASAAQRAQQQARAVFAAQARGEPQSCLALHAAAALLSAPSQPLFPGP